MIHSKRIYEPADPSDGIRILIDGLWPRGVRKQDANIHEWVKDIAPSADLRKWFGHKPERWEEFAKRYRLELKEPLRAECLKRLRNLADKGTLTIVLRRVTKHGAMEQLYAPTPKDMTTFHRYRRKTDGFCRTFPASIKSKPCESQNIVAQIFQKELVRDFSPSPQRAPIIGSFPSSKGLVASGRNWRAGSGSSGVCFTECMHPGRFLTAWFGHASIRKVVRLFGLN